MPIRIGTRVLQSIHPIKHTLAGSARSTSAVLSVNVNACSCPPPPPPIRVPTQLPSWISTPPPIVRLLRRSASTTARSLPYDLLRYRTTSHATCYTMSHASHATERYLALRVPHAMLHCPALSRFIVDARSHGVYTARYPTLPETGAKCQPKEGGRHFRVQSGRSPTAERDYPARLEALRVSARASCTTIT